MPISETVAEYGRIDTVKTHALQCTTLTKSPVVKSVVKWVRTQVKKSHLHKEMCQMIIIVGLDPSISVYLSLFQEICKIRKQMIILKNISKGKGSSCIDNREQRKGENCTINEINNGKI